MSTKWDLRHLVETVVPRANHLTISLPEFNVKTRNKQVWHQIVRALKSEPSNTASYGRLVELLGVRGDAEGARQVRAALSALISGSVPLAPTVKRVGRGVYQLVE